MAGRDHYFPTDEEWPDNTYYPSYSLSTRYHPFNPNIIPCIDTKESTIDHINTWLESRGHSWRIPLDLARDLGQGSPSREENNTTRQMDQSTRPWVPGIGYVRFSRPRSPQQPRVGHYREGEGAPYGAETAFSVITQRDGQRHPQEFPVRITISAARVGDVQYRVRMIPAEEQARAEYTEEAQYNEMRRRSAEIRQVFERRNVEENSQSQGNLLSGDRPEASAEPTLGFSQLLMRLRRSPAQSELSRLYAQHDLRLSEPSGPVVEQWAEEMTPGPDGEWLVASHRPHR